MHAELPVVSFLSAAFLFIIIPLHYARLSIAHLSILVWLAVGNIIQGVNAIVWTGNTEMRIPVWCDISTKVVLCINVVLPACIVCICRQLELLSSSREIPCPPRGARNRTILEIACCTALPVLYATLHSIVQDHRFTIVADFGCTPSILPSVPGIFLVWLPPLATCAIGFTYIGLVLAHYFRRRADFTQYLVTRTHLTNAHFMRLLVTSTLQLFLLLILAISSISSDVSGGLRPWISWASVHAKFLQVPRLATQTPQIVFAWWAIPVLSLISVISFAVSDAQAALEILEKRKAGRERSGSESWIDTSDLPRR
ncbi:hypothetical protein PLICRDRAFT_118514 [Plicaturopsis crispa FD-325 SS-3]|uniref:Fungal pheromone STE3G-protein-coupled receptor n=1 Tax=Plicaturopsis crispa FD-325 SS-3 TaxID=944288 RepID=A0A0C9T4A3_PLICR|nr:hypothetical protein PLICRDRAFT_118514 [Plicaturopsis crispa FD-325 SS-3]